MGMDESGELIEPGGKVRLFVEASLGAGARVTPDTQQAHYLLHVMRAKAGTKISLFNGRDGEWLAVLGDVTKRACVLLCEKQTAPQAATPDVWLVFAPVKKTPADYVVQKATELGVRALVPVLTRRTIVRRVNRDRMHANAVEAAEQSGRLTVPDVREPVSLEKLLADWPAERRILFCDEAGAPPIAQALQNWPPSHAGGGAAQGGAGEADAWAILTGPEGGFDPGERETIRSHDFVVPVFLGGRILRADTAALAALSVWQALRGDWR